MIIFNTTPSRAFSWNSNRSHRHHDKVGRALASTVISYGSNRRNNSYSTTILSMAMPTLPVGLDRTNLQEFTVITAPSYYTLSCNNNGKSNISSSQSSQSTHHSLPPGTWGILRVYQGELEYTIMRISSLSSEQYCVPKEGFLVSSMTGNGRRRMGVIEPQVRYSVNLLSEDVRFAVELYQENKIKKMLTGWTRMTMTTTQQWITMMISNLLILRRDMTVAGFVTTTKIMTKIMTTTSRHTIPCS